MNNFKEIYKTEKRNWGNKSLQEKGFTLIEAFLALLIFSITFLGLTALQATVIENNSLNKKFTTATALAKDKIEELKNKEYSHSDLSVAIHTDSNNPVNERGEKGGIFNRKWTVSEGSGTKDITVYVSWNSGKHQVSLATKIIQ